MKVLTTADIDASLGNRIPFWLRIAALNGVFVVALGAFGAHALRGILDDAAAKTWQTAVFYHAIHMLAILACSLLLRFAPTSRAHIAAWLFLIGIVLFSGSLYILSSTGLTWLGAVTPFGGAAFLAGWAVLAFSVPFNTVSPKRS